jgi:FAD/FMN-containing dehydrogenase
MNHIEKLRKIRGLAVITDRATKLAANDPRRYGEANADYLALVIAETRIGLRQLLQYCRSNGVKVVTRSGGTALTNGSSIDETRPPGDYILLKLYSPGKICFPEFLDERGSRVKIFPGNTSKMLNSLLEAVGRYIPVNLGIGDIGDEKGIAQLLGYIATDAAGTGAAFHGRTRDIVESMVVATADGTIWRLPSQCKKCPPMEAFFGMGGTTGIILEAVIRTAELPVTRQVAVVRIEHIGQMYDLLEAFKRNCWENMNLFERLNAELFEQVISFASRQDDPNTELLRQLGKGDLLFVELTSTEDQADLVTPLRRSLRECNLFESSTIAETVEHGHSLLGYRVVTASKACDWYAKTTGGKVVAFDISVPTGDTDEFPSQRLLQELRERIPGIRLFSFGHAAGVELISSNTGRGGTAIHFDPVVPPGTSDDLVAWLRRMVFSEVFQRGGNMISEHTAGTKLVPYLQKYAPDVYAQIVQLKARWDHKCTLNPGAYVYPADVFKYVAGR